MLFLQKVSTIIETNKLTNLLVFTGLLFSLARIVRSTDNFYILALLSFVLLWISNFRSIFKKDLWLILFWFLPFGIWCLMSSVWSLEPFISLSRGLFYIFISSTAVLIGFLYKNKLSELMKLFFIINGLIIFISFISLFSGIPNDAWTANHGMGFTSIFTHQNTLAAVLMFTLIGPVYYLLVNMGLGKGEKLKFKSKNLIYNSEKARGESTIISNHRFIGVRSLKKKDLLFSILILVSNLLFIYLSYSRSVMLSLFIGGVILVYLLGNLRTNLIFSIGVVILGLSLFSFFGDGLNIYLKKGGSDYFSRRNILWEPSYQAALNGGFIGLGYGITDPTVASNYKKQNRFDELKREKGNSILALVEETGIIGLVLFLLPFLFLIREIFLISFKNSQFLISNFEFILPFAFLLTFLVHAQFEAWWVGVSSFYLIVFLTMISGIIVNSIGEQ